MLLDWGDRDLLIDNSIYGRRDHPIVRERWERATEDGQLVLPAPLLMEVGYSAKNGTAAQESFEDLRDAYDTDLLDRGVWERAMQAQVELAQVGAGYQRRFSIADLLTAALADQRGFGVLHYDRDFDDIRDGSSLSYESIWAAEPPSLDTPPESDADAKALRKSLRLLLGTLDDTDDAQVLGEMFDKLSDMAREAGLDPSPRLPPGK